MKDNNLERLIKDTYIEFNNEMDIHSNIEIPEFNNVINKFNNNLKEKSTSSSLGKKIALVASFTVVILISTFLSSIPKVIAFKFKVVKTFEELRGEAKDIKITTGDIPEDSLVEGGHSGNPGDQIEKLLSIDEAREEVPFKLLVPEYLPDGYKIDSVKHVKSMGGYHRVEQNYVNDGKQIIQLWQNTVYEESRETLSVSSQLRTEDININNLKIKLITDDKNFKNLIWFHNNIKFDMTAYYNIEDSEVKKIIKSLK